MPLKDKTRYRNQKRKRTRPQFWDNLSRVPLCRRALREFNRRTVRPLAPRPPARSVLERDQIKQIKRFVRRGGPTVRDIRGYLEQKASTVSKTKSTGTKHSGSSSIDTMTTRLTAKDPAFEQALLDIGVSPFNHGAKPSNIQEIQARLAQPRASLSVSKFSDEDFDELVLRSERATSKVQVMTDVFPIIRGKETMQSGQSQPFNHLKRLGEHIAVAQPNYYNGSLPTHINQRVRKDLGGYIVPSTQKHRPALPNFFTEVKGSDGKASEVKRQITHDLAYGARAMHQVQSYGQDQPVYDGNAYAFGATISGDYTLQLYGMHVTAPASPGGEAEYHTTQMDGYHLTSNLKNCRSGLAAYRNLQDFAGQKRDGFIARANEIALAIGGGDDEEKEKDEEEYEGYEEFGEDKEDGEDEDEEEEDENDGGEDGEDEA